MRHPQPGDIEYKGCIIDAKFLIWSKATGLPLFRKHWQLAINLEDAKLTIDMSDISKEVCKGKRILAAPAVVHKLDFDEVEAARQEAEEREADKIDDYWERNNDERWD